MQPKYEHTQFGTAMLILLLLPLFALVAVFTLAARSAPPLPLVIILAVLFFVAFLFRSLTVRVDVERVLLYFGPGFPRRSFPLERITGVRVVRNTPLMGLGIHFISRGMIYNISGLDAVEITLEDGSLARIGTDEPAALAQAIEESIWHR